MKKTLFTGKRVLASVAIATAFLVTALPVSAKVVSVSAGQACSKRNALDKASNYAFVVTDPLASALDISATDDVARAQSLNALIGAHCEDLPHKIGFDLQLRQKLRCL
jgi:hypothetical protein